MHPLSIEYSYLKKSWIRLKPGKYKMLLKSLSLIPYWKIRMLRKSKYLIALVNG